MATTLHDPRYKVLVRMLVDARIAAGLSQQALADRIDRPQSFIGKIETLERRLDALELFDLVDALGTDVEAFAKEAAVRVAARKARRRRP